MKCVGFLIFVLLVQSVDKFFREKSGKFKSPNVSDDFASYDEFRYKLNVSDGVVFPEDLLLTVPFTDISANLLTSFLSLQRTLSDVSGCSSTTVSSVAKTLHTLLNKLANNIATLSDNRSSLSEHIPEAFSSIVEAISSLEIGTSVTDAVIDIKTKLLQVIQVLDEAQNSEFNVTKKFNDAVSVFSTSVQVVIVSIAVIVESAAAKLGIISTQLKEIVVSLTLIVQTTVVFVQSTNTKIASIVSFWPKRITPSSSILNSFLVILDRTMLSQANAITSITSSSVTSSMSLVVSTVSVSLTSSSYKLNEWMDKLHVSVVLEVPNKLESIVFTLVGSTGDFDSSIANSTATITSAIAAISSSDSGIKSKITRQLYPVFKGLLRLTGSDDEILADFISSLSSILDVLKIAGNNLTFGIGVEVTNGLIKSIEDIFASLKEVLSSVNDESINVKNVDRVAKECAKHVQIFDSIVVATFKTISRAIDTVNAVALEAIVASQILHTAVLYVTEWVTATASSIFLTKAGKTHDHLTSLAIIIVVMLQRDSKIIEMIAGSVTQDVPNVVRLIASPLRKVSRASSAIAEISGINANTDVKIEQIDFGGQDISVQGIVDTTEGNLSQILNGLTGSLSSISPTFSSSLQSLKKSLKQITSSQSEILHTISGSLTSVTTQLSEISGSSTQILTSTSNALNSLFGHLLDTISRLSALGDITASVSSSVANILAALHSLIHAINTYKGSVFVITDSVRTIAKTVQIFISTYSAIVTATVKAGSAVVSSVSPTITALPYLVANIILVVQQVVGAAIPALSLTAGSITTVHYKLALALSEILEAATSIAADVTSLVTDGVLVIVPSKIRLPVSNLNNFTTSSLSKLSGVVADIQVTLGIDKQSN